MARKTRTIGPTRWFWSERLAQSPHREVCGPKVSHNRPTGKFLERKTRTIAPPGSLWAEKLAQSPHREVCGSKDSHNRPTGKSVARKTRTIAPTRWFWSEKLVQSAATKVFRPVVRRRQSTILWVIRSLRLSDQKRLDEGQPSAFARRLCWRITTFRFGLSLFVSQESLRKIVARRCGVRKPQAKACFSFSTFKSLRQMGISNE